jgi:hypothetical protein
VASRKWEAQAAELESIATLDVRSGEFYTAILLYGLLEEKL